MNLFKKRIHLFSILICALLIALSAQEPTPELLAPINYQVALERAIQNDPALRGFDTANEAAEGQVEQAGLRPNPVVGLEMENILGSGPFRDVQGMDITLGITQLIETGEKRQKRTELAQTERALIGWNRELRLATIESEVRAAFVNLLLAQNVLELRKEQLSLAERSRTETARLVEAARSNQVELTRAELSVRQQRFAISQAERSLEAARVGLAALWGESRETDFVVAGSIQIETDLPEMDQLLALLPQNAYLAPYKAYRLKREAVLALEQAKAKPDFEVFGGVRYFNSDSGDAAFVAGIEIPWPMFDKNQGNIRTARAHVRSLEYDEAATRRELILALTAAYQNLVTAHVEARSVLNDLLPSAEQTLKETEAGYERGQFTLLAVLESRSTLFQIRETYLEALSRYATAQAQIKALTRPATKINESI